MERRTRRERKRPQHLSNRNSSPVAYPLVDSTQNTGTGYGRGRFCCDRGRRSGGRPRPRSFWRKVIHWVGEAMGNLQVMVVGAGTGGLSLAHGLSAEGVDVR